MGGGGGGGGEKHELLGRGGARNAGRRLQTTLNLMLLRATIDS